MLAVLVFFSDLSRGGPFGYRRFLFRPRSRLWRGCGGVLSNRRRISSRRFSSSFSDFGFLTMVKTSGSQEAPPPETVTKLEAARRQLNTAISLWFHGGDTVSVYTLSHAAYEIIHNLSRTKRTRDLLFDSVVVKDEYRKQFNSMLRNPANFFKHAKREKADDETLEFYPSISEMFITYALLGLEFSGMSLTRPERAFALWVKIHKPEWLTAQGRESLLDRFSIDQIDELRQLSKSDLFDAVTKPGG